MLGGYTIHIKAPTRHGTNNKAGFPIAARLRKISNESDKELGAIHLETSRANFEKAKVFLRKHFSKDSETPYLTGFPVIYIPDRVHHSALFLLLLRANIHQQGALTP